MVIKWLQEEQKELRRQFKLQSRPDFTDWFSLVS